MIDKKLTLKEVRRFAEGRIDFIGKKMAEFGPVFQLKLLWIDLLVISDANLIRELLVKKVAYIHKEQRTNNIVRRITGDSILTTEGDVWKRKRKLVQPAFHTSYIESYVDVMANYTQEMVSRWNSEDAFAIDEAFQALTMRIITKTMFNVDIAKEAEEIGRNITIALEIAQEQLGAAVLLPEWVPSASNRKHKQAMSAVRNVLQQIIAERKASGRNEGDLLSMLIQARDENGDALTDQELLDESLTVFGAGHETTAALMSWAVYLLTQHPEKAAKVKKEVDAVLGDKTVSFETLAELIYTESFIKEVLRLYPPAFGVGRVAVEDFTLGSREVKKGTVILLDIYHMQRSAEYFLNPERFWPERWAAEQSKPERHAYIPFGAGPRMCVGNVFAMMEAKIILATLVQKVEIDPLFNHVEKAEKFTLKPKEPLWVKIIRRDDP